MQGPIDYWGQLSNVDVGKAFNDSFQLVQQRRLEQAQQARALQQQQQLDAAREAAIRDPSAANFNRLFILDPKSHESIKAAHDSMDADTQKATLRDVSAIRGYLRAGKPDLAKAMLQRRIDADKAAGQDTADDEQMLSLIDEDPDAAASAADYQLAGVMGPDKWEATFKAVGDDRRADEAQPGVIAKAAAETGKLQAEAAKTGAETVEIAPNAESERKLREAQAANFYSAITERAERLNLDRDELETKTQLELEKLQGKGVDLSPTSEKSMTDAVVSAESSRQLANRASALADKIAVAPLTGGWGAWLAQNAQGAFGNPNLLRKEYTALINAQAVKNLPPGPASDRDIKLALQGFPSPTANADTMASFLRGMAKLQNIAANREQARADWISENGNIGRAKRDITVNGVKVPAGATLSDFSNSAASIERRESVASDRSYMRFGGGK